MMLYVLRIAILLKPDTIEMRFKIQALRFGMVWSVGPLPIAPAGHVQTSPPPPAQFADDKCIFHTEARVQQFLISSFFAAGKAPSIAFA